MEFPDWVQVKGKNTILITKEIALTRFSVIFSQTRVRNPVTVATA